MYRSPNNPPISETPRRARWVLLAPFIVVLGILCCSPNFQAAPDGQIAIRTDPLGSDFLQEWVGGYIMASPDRAKLYHSEHFLAVQHDAELIGFEWPSEEYYPMIYPPFYYLFTSPFTALPYMTAMWAWMLMLAAVLAGYFWLVLRYFPRIGKRPSHVSAILLASLVAFTPLLSSLTMAHKSALLLLILAATYLLLHHRRPLTAGIVFGLIAFKPHLGLLVGIAMLLKGQWRFVAGSAISVGALVGLCFLAGPNLCVDYFQQCLGLGDYTSTGGYAMAEAHSLHAVCHLAFDWISPDFALVVAGTLAIAVVFLLNRILRGELETGSQRFGLQFASLVVATVLISPHFYQYDLTILLVPMMIVWSVLSGGWGESPSITINETHRRWLLGTTVGLFLGAGLFASIANATHIQPCTVLLLSLLATVWSLVGRKQTSRNSRREVAALTVCPNPAAMTGG